MRDRVVGQLGGGLVWVGARAKKCGNIGGHSTELCVCGSVSV